MSLLKGDVENNDSAIRDVSHATTDILLRVTRELHALYCAFGEKLMVIRGLPLQDHEHGPMLKGTGGTLDRLLAHLHTHSPTTLAVTMDHVVYVEKLSGGSGPATLQVSIDTLPQAKSL